MCSRGVLKQPLKQSHILLEGLCKVHTDFSQEQNECFYGVFARRWFRGVLLCVWNAKGAICFLEKVFSWQVSKVIVMRVGCEAGVLVKGNIECKAGTLLSECVCEKGLMQRKGGI